VSVQRKRLRRSLAADPGALTPAEHEKLMTPGPNALACGVGLVSVMVCTAAGSLTAMLASLGTRRTTADGAGL
jgi:hypothetical protein